nr:hypothetical protein CFP56_70180 [Quercus suber]
MDLPEVCSHILAFLREAETPKLGKTPISSGNEQEKAPQLDRAPVVFPRFTKLHLAEAQEMHKQKYDEVQALDRAHREFFYRIVIFSEEMLESTKPRMTSSLATLASMSHLSRVEELKGSSDERPALFSGNPFESTVIELASGSKTSLQNQPDAELIAPISKTKEWKKPLLFG